ncbi:unnamed protein product [Mucor fragilis]
MDYDSDSSDFHFPSDTGLAKLSSPLSFKVPESRDWALDEFMQTLQDKPCTQAENLLSFKQYIPVQSEEDEEEDDDEEDDFLNYGPPKLSLPTLEEKDFLAQLSQHFLNLERIELHDILKGGFTLVQNDIQSNNTQNYNTHTTHTSSPPGLSWFNEAVDYGRHEIDNLDTIEIPKRKNNFSPFEQMAAAASAGRHGNNNNATTVASFSIRSEQQEITTVVSPQVEKPLPPLPQPTSLSSAAPTTTTATTSNSSSQKKKGLKYKLKQFVKPFNKSTTTTTSEKPKKSFIKNTRKFIRNIF